MYMQNTVRVYRVIRENVCDNRKRRRDDRDLISMHNHANFIPHTEARNNKHSKSSGWCLLPLKAF